MSNALLQDIKPPIVVTAAIIRDGSRVLVARRPHHAKIGAGKWEFPGGKVEGGEHPESALRREIREELQIDVEVMSFYDLVSHVYLSKEKNLHIVLLCYLCRQLNGALNPTEADEIRWISKADFADMEFVEADLPIVARLQREL